MTEIEVVLADCVDMWMSGQDPAPILRRHPDVADEVSQLLDVAKAVYKSGSLLQALPYARRFPAIEPGFSS